MSGPNEDAVDERFDRTVKRALANITADAILRDIGILQRAWQRYQREHPTPPAGQLDLFTQPL